MSIHGQLRTIAQEVVTEAQQELRNALAAAEARIEALEARLGGGTDEPGGVTETAAKAPRRGGRKPAGDAPAAVEEPATDTAPEADAQ